MLAAPVEEAAVRGKAPARSSVTSPFTPSAVRKFAGVVAQASSPKTAVVITVHGALEYLALCLDSIAEHTTGVHLFIADDSANAAESEQVSFPVRAWHFWAWRLEHGHGVAFLLGGVELSVFYRLQPNQKAPFLSCHAFHDSLPFLCPSCVRLQLSEMLQRMPLPSTHIIMDPKEAKGYTLTINAGLRRAHEMGCTAMICLNSDTVVTPMWLEALLATLQADPKIGMAGEEAAPGCGCAQAWPNCCMHRLP